MGPYVQRRDESAYQGVGPSGRPGPKTVPAARPSGARFAAIAALSAFLPASAAAADLTSSESAVAAPAQFDERRYGDFRDTLHDWNVVIGGGAIYKPEYEGSDKFEVKPFPLISATYGDWLHLNTKGLTVDVWKWEGFKVSARGGYEVGRNDNDSRYLKGLGDIDPGGVVGGLLSYQAGPFQIYAGLDQTIGGSEGMTGTFGGKASHQYERFIFSADASATWANNRHMDAYFGISSRQSLNSGLPEYEAKSGIKRVDLSASVTYMVTENWLVTGVGGAGLLVGDAKDSPVVKDDVQPFVMLGAGYRF
ncbi:MipA/OmpV family protein [Methylopila sp. 73B]|uniref:MipA/OmpV family protein n=1 Tax=Methylopila sp. 73B TaxID=1120792 RepID=UPI0012DEAF96|nr:MipA/OmpV family protein [Methylopila sp. 73B]